MKRLVVLALIVLAFAVTSPTAEASTNGPVNKAIPGCDTAWNNSYVSTTTWVDDTYVAWRVYGQVTAFSPCGVFRFGAYHDNHWVQVNRFYYPVGWVVCAKVASTSRVIDVWSYSARCPEQGWPPGFTAYVVGQEFHNGSIHWGSWEFV